MLLLFHEAFEVEEEIEDDEPPKELATLKGQETSPFLSLSLSLSLFLSLSISLHCCLLSLSLSIILPVVICFSLCGIL